jgi:hypothetical protein
MCVVVEHIYQSITPLYRYAGKQTLEIDYSKYDFKDPELYVYKSKPGSRRRLLRRSRA